MCPLEQPAGMFVRCRFAPSDRRSRRRFAVEAFGDSLDLEAGGAGAPHLRLEGTGRHRRPSIPVHDLSSLWKFAPPPTSVIAVNPTVEER